MEKSAAYLGAALAIGMATISTGLGIGWLASRAMDGIARQPEASGKIQGAMIVAIALLEAICLYALVIALMLVTKY